MTFKWSHSKFKQFSLVEHICVYAEFDRHVSSPVIDVDNYGDRDGLGSGSELARTAARLLPSVQRAGAHRSITSTSGPMTTASRTAPIWTGGSWSRSRNTNAAATNPSTAITMDGMLSDSPARLVPMRRSGWRPTQLWHHFDSIAGLVRSSRVAFSGSPRPAQHLSKT